MARQNAPLSERDRLQQKVKNGRGNLLVAMAFTLLNILLFFTGSEMMLVFSISVPYYVLIFTWAMEILLAGLLDAAVVLVMYFLCWLLSKRRPVFLLIAAILFAVDTLCLILLYIWAQDFSGILDFGFHVLVLYYLFSGYAASRKLKALPEEELLPEEDAQAPVESLARDGSTKRKNPVSCWRPPTAPTISCTVG